MADRFDSNIDWDTTRGNYHAVKKELKNLCGVLEKAAKSSWGAYFQEHTDIPLLDVVDSISQADTIIAVLAESHNELYQQYDECYKDLYSAASEIDELKQQLSDTTKSNDVQITAIANLSSQKSELERHVELITSDLESNKAKISDYEQELSALRSLDSAKSQSIQEYREIKPQLEANILRLKNELEEASSKIDAQGKDIRSLVTQIEDNHTSHVREVAKAAEEAYEMRSRELQPVIERAKSDYNAALKELDNANSTIASQEKKIDAQHAECTQLEDSLRSIERKLKDTQSDSDLAREKYEYHMQLSNSEAESLKLQLRDLNDRALQFERDCNAKVTEYEESINKLKKELDQLRTDLHTKEALISKLEYSQEQSEIKFERNAVEITSLKSQLHEKENSIKVLDSKCAEWEKKYQEGRTVEDALKEKVSKFEKATAKQAVRLQELESANVGGLKRELEESAAVIEDLKRVKEQFHLEASQWNILNADLSSQISQSNTYNQQLQRDLEFYKSKESQTSTVIRSQFDQEYTHKVSDLELSFQKAMSSKETELTQMESSREFYQNKYQEVCNTLGETGRKVDELSAELELMRPLRDQVSHLQSQVSSLSNENQDLVGKLSDCNFKLSSAESKLQHSEAMLQDHSHFEAEFSKKSQEVKSLVAKNRSLSQMLEEAVESGKSQQHISARLESQLNETSQLITTLQSQNTDLGAKNREAEERYTHLMQQMLEVLQRKQTLLSRLRFIKKLHDSLLPRLDQYVSGFSPAPNTRTLKGAFLIVLAAVKFKAGGDKQHNRPSTPVIR